jgi:Protein of unknown function (DUF2971)
MARSIPKYLYKYRAVNADALAMLATDKVYLSRLDAFNDPFEVLSVDPTLETKLLTDKDGHFAVAKDASHTDGIGTSLRVCSLSEESQDLLMWGHYADCHRGFCIRFELENDAELAKLVHPIQYKESASDFANEEESEFERALRNSLEKSEKWSYEREWRIIGKLPENESRSVELFATYAPEALSGIIFGIRTPELHKALIRKILGERPVEYLQAEKRQENFALAIRRERE